MALDLFSHVVVRYLDIGCFPVSCLGNEPISSFIKRRWSCRWRASITISFGKELELAAEWLCLPDSMLSRCRCGNISRRTILETSSSTLIWDLWRFSWASTHFLLSGFCSKNRFIFESRQRCSTDDRSRIRTMSVLVTENFRKWLQQGGVCGGVLKPGL